MNIKPILKYPCPETSELFDSLEEAKNNAAQEIAQKKRREAKALRLKARTAKLDKLRNSIRLEAESVQDIEEMLNSRAKLLYPNQKMPKVTIAGVRVPHFEIKNKAPVAFRNCAEVSFELNFPSKDGHYDKVLQLVESGWSNQRGFHGFSSGGGGTGRHYVRISLKNWPKLWEKYRKMLALQSIQRNNVSKEREAETKACQKASSDPDYLKLSVEVDAILLKQRELYRDLKKKYYKAPNLKNVAAIDELKAAFTI